MDNVDDFVFGSIKAKKFDIRNLGKNQRYFYLTKGEINYEE